MTTTTRRARPAGRVTTEQPLLLDSYPDAIAVIGARGIPLPVVVMHLKHGFRPDATCGDCSSRLQLWVNGVHHYCSRSFSQSDLPGDTPACGKWHARQPALLEAEG